jgi:GNAT superfamily N-acetyltransferase
MRLDFRAMTPEDQKSVNYIQKDAYQKRFLEKWRFLLDKLKWCPEGCWICTAHGKPVGYMFSHPACLISAPLLNQMLDHSKTDDCYFIHDIARLDSHRGNKIGNRFLDYALKCAAKKGFAIIAGVAVQNTRKRWERLGFEPFTGPEKVLRYISEHYGDDACYMVRRLD